MLDSIALKLIAYLTPEFLKLLRILTDQYIAAVHPEAEKLIFGCWSLTLNAKPHKKFGHGRLWIATHINFGIKIGIVDGVIVFVSASLPRLILGSNYHHITNQASLNQAIELLIKVVGPVSDIHEATQKATFNRLDLVQSLPVKLNDVKSTLRYARHRCAHGEATYRDNSVMFDGTNVQVFFYDKEKKQRLEGSGTRTRAEVRLRNSAAIARYPGLVGPGLVIDFDRAREVYREILSQFPEIKTIAKQDHYTFLAVIAATDRTYEGISLFDAYLKMVCSSPDAVSRVRREVAKRVPTVTGVHLADLAA